MQLLAPPDVSYTKYQASIWYTGLVLAPASQVTTLWVEQPERLLGASVRERRIRWAPDPLEISLRLPDGSRLPLRLVAA